MKIPKISLFLSSLVGMCMMLVSFAGHTQETDTESASGHKFELAKQYYGDCTNADDARFDKIQPYLKAFTDMEVMADMMADPLKFSSLMTVVNDPHTIHVMTKCATEPVMWDTWMNGMTDFNKMSRVAARFMNPGMYMAWMTAPMNPAMYQPMMQMMNADYYNRWMTAMMNPVYYEPMMSLANPAWYTPRINWMMNPQSMQPMFNMMNFATSAGATGSGATGSVGSSVSE